MKESEIGLDDYRRSLFSSKQMAHKQTRIMQREHELHKVKTKRTSFRAEKSGEAFHKQKFNGMCVPEVSA